MAGIVGINAAKPLHLRDAEPQSGPFEELGADAPTRHYLGNDRAHTNLSRTTPLVYELRQSLRKRDRIRQRCVPRAKTIGWNRKVSERLQMPD